MAEIKILRESKPAAIVCGQMPDILEPSASILAGIFWYLVKYLPDLNARIHYCFYGEDRERDNYVKVYRPVGNFIIRVMDNIAAIHICGTEVVLSFHRAWEESAYKTKIDMQLSDSLQQITNWIMVYGG